MSSSPGKQKPSAPGDASSTSSGLSEQDVHNRARVRPQNRAHKAPTIVFHRNGCPSSDTRKWVIRSKESFTNLLDQLAHSYHMPVRAIFEAGTGRRIYSLSDLVDGGVYVVSDSLKYKDVGYGSLVTGNRSRHSGHHHHHGSALATSRQRHALPGTTARSRRSSSEEEGMRRFSLPNASAFHGDRESAAKDNAHRLNVFNGPGFDHERSLSSPSSPFGRSQSASPSRSRARKEVYTPPALARPPPPTSALPRPAFARPSGVQGGRSESAVGPEQDTPRQTGGRLRETLSDSTAMMQQIAASVTQEERDGASALSTAASSAFSAAPESLPCRAIDVLGEAVPPRSALTRPKSATDGLSSARNSRGSHADERSSSSQRYWHGIPVSSLQPQAKFDLELSADTQTSGETVVARVLVINTGGTIGMRNTPDGYAPSPGYMEQLVRSLPMMHDKEYANPDMLGPGLVTPLSSFGRRIYYEFVEYDPLLDSSNMDMTDWVRIAKDIFRYYPHWDGFVIIHGTDTMTYTASALSFMLENLGKSVILTGAQLPMCETFSDGLANFLGALTIAGHCVVPEVALFFNNKLYRGNRTSKSSATGFDAFKSPNLPALVEVGTKLAVKGDLIFRPSKIAPLKIHTNLSRHVGLLRLFPGISAETVESFLNPPMAGVVVQTYGAGNGPDRRKDLLRLFKDASDRGVIIINTSQCLEGNVSDAYRAGRMLRHAGLIPGHDMTPECALTKLAYVLGRDVSIDRKRRLMEENLRGELTLMLPETSLSLQDNSFVLGVAKALAASSGREVGQIQKALAPVLLCSAAQSGEVERLKTLKDQGFDPNCCDYDGRTPLHLAAAEGHGEAVRFLLEQGAHVHVKDRFGWTPLRDAAASGSEAVVGVLRQGLWVRSWDEELVFKSCACLLRSCPLVTLARFGMNDPPYLTCYVLAPLRAISCASAGAQLGMVSVELACLLNRLTSEERIDELKLWIAAGADLTVSDYESRTPLHIAVARGNIEAVRLLLSSPTVDLSLVDSSGLTPLEIALQRGYDAIAECITAQAAATHQAVRGSGTLSSADTHQHQHLQLGDIV